MCHFLVVDWDESFKEMLNRVIEENKEVLDALAEYDKRPIGNAFEEMKVGYEAECTAAQSLAQAEAEAQWREERDAEMDREAAEHSGPEGDEP